MRTASWIARLGPFLLCALPFLAAACGGSSRHSAAPCTSGDLQAHVGRTRVGLGNYANAIRLTNVGGSACVLDGYATVRFLDAGGRVVGTAAHGSSYLFHDPGPRRIVLRPGKSASFSLHSTAPSGRACRMAKRLAVIPPGATKRLLLKLQVAVCPPAPPQISALVPGPQGAPPR